MAFKQLTNGIRVAMEYLWEGKTVTNIIHVVSDVLPTEAILHAVGDVVAAWLVDEVMPSLSHRITATLVVATDINTPNSIQVVTPITVGGDGSVEQDSTPNNVALVASLRTQQTGRSFRGRFYVPGLPETVVTGNTIPVSTQLAWALRFADLDTSLDVIDVEWVVASFFSLGIPRVAGIGTRIDSVVIGARVDTQRRRLPEE